MKIKSINLKQHDVQAFLHKRKTQHRIPIKPQPEMIIMSERATESLKALIPNESNLQWGYKGCGVLPWPSGMTLYSKILPGDILYVKETWCLTQPYHPEAYHYGYKDGSSSYTEANERYDYSTPDVWKSSIHMPMEAARIWLRVKDVRVERLQDISEDDAVAEGILRDNEGLNCFHYTQSRWRFITNKTSYATLWESIHGLGTWEANPWVWVYELEQFEKPTT